MKKIIFTIILILLCNIAYSQKLGHPFDFPMQLSGGFCDLRTNHFHAGIDFRTQGTEGHALHAVADGYISRISVSPWGYGNAIYITHPDDSIVTVYGHLQRFNNRISEIVLNRQYEEESFSIDIKFKRSDLPVHKGDIIGYSGNSGSSGGPHLHFEVRNLKTDDLTDPLAYFKDEIPDKCKPLLRGIMIYPIEEKGIVNGKTDKQKIDFILDKNNNPTIKNTIEAWGEIGLAIKAADRMDGTGFSYGIKDIVMTIDSLESFRYTANRFSHDESSLMNGCIDYDEWRNDGGKYFKTFVAPGNPLRMQASRNNGIINIKEERTYNIQIVLSDINGNQTIIPLKIKGKKQTIPVMNKENTYMLRWYDYNVFYAKGVQLSIKHESLYDNVLMRYGNTSSPNFFSQIHRLHTTYIPLYNSAQLSVFIDNADAGIDSSKYGIVRVNKYNERSNWIGGHYRDGWIDAEISELGNYAVSCDTTPPIIKPINPTMWHKGKKITLRITDNLSGIESYRGEIDGKYALFEYDAKKALLTYKFDDERLYPGYHKLRITVVDACSNKEIYTDAFTW